jgi:peroxiredoxin
MKTKFVLIALLSVFCFHTNAQTTDDRGYLVKVGDMAPDFSIKLTTGKTIQLKDLKGKIVMLQFTASWCGVCRKEMPFIESDIWQKHKSNPNFALIAIDRDEPLETVLKFAESTKITYPIGLDPNANIFALYAQREAGITRNVIIDKLGKIVLLTRLFNDTEFNEMKNKIEELLK